MKNNTLCRLSILKRVFDIKILLASYSMIKPMCTSVRHFKWSYKKVRSYTNVSHIYLYIKRYMYIIHSQ